MCCTYKSFICNISHVTRNHVVLFHHETGKSNQKILISLTVQAFRVQREEEDKEWVVGNECRGFVNERRKPKGLCWFTHGQTWAWKILGLCVCPRSDLHYHCPLQPRDVYVMLLQPAAGEKSIASQTPFLLSNKSFLVTTALSVTWPPEHHAQKTKKTMSPSSPLCRCWEATWLIGLILEAQCCSCMFLSLQQLCYTGMIIRLG